MPGRSRARYGVVHTTLLRTLKRTEAAPVPRGIESGAGSQPVASSDARPVPIDSHDELGTSDQWGARRSERLLVDVRGVVIPRALGPISPRQGSTASWPTTWTARGSENSPTLRHPPMHGDCPPTAAQRPAAPGRAQHRPAGRSRQALPRRPIPPGNQPTHGSRSKGRPRITAGRELGDSGVRRGSLLSCSGRLEATASLGWRAARSLGRGGYKICYRHDSRRV